MAQNLKITFEDEHRFARKKNPENYDESQWKHRIKYGSLKNPHNEQAIKRMRLIS